jgi:hypothetical protein
MLKISEHEAASAEIAATNRAPNVSSGRLQETGDHLAGRIVGKMLHAA